VCGGIAEQTGIPAIWVRLGVVLLSLATGVVALAYVLAWMFVPSQPALGGGPDHRQLPPGS